MAPIPYPHDPLTATTTATMHQLSRRDAEQSRIAGMLVGCLIGGLVAVGLVYYCVNCVFGKEPRKKGDQQQQQPHHHHHHVHEPHDHAHPRQHRHTVRLAHEPHTHAHAHAHGHGHVRHPHAHRWTHHHHRHSHRHHHHPKRKTKTKRSTKTRKDKSARRGRGSSNRPRGTTVRFMPMPSMEMPVGPAPVAAGMGIGMGVGIGAGDEFIDYGPPPGMEPGQDVAWGLDPGFPLEQFADGDDPGRDHEAGCNGCCFAFWDALCGVEPGSRDLGRDADLDPGRVVLEEDEMAAV